MAIADLGSPRLSLPGVMRPLPVQRVGRRRQQVHPLCQRAAFLGSSGGGWHQTDLFLALSSLLFPLHCAILLLKGSESHRFHPHPAPRHKAISCSLTAAAQDHCTQVSGGQRLFGPRAPGSIAKRLRRSLGSDRRSSCVSRMDSVVYFSPGGGLCLLAADREGPGGAGPGLG